MDPVSVLYTGYRDFVLRIRICMDPQHFEKPDPGYPLYREKPDSQSSQKADPVPHLLRLNMEPLGLQ